MKKLILFFCCFTLLSSQYIFAQNTSGSILISADAQHLLPITRSAALEMGDGLVGVVNLYEFTDLIQGNVPAIAEEGKFYLSAEAFYALSPERKVHVLQNPNIYIVVASASAKPKTVISAAVFQGLPLDKQQAILNSGDYTIE